MAAAILPIALPLLTDAIQIFGPDISNFIAGLVHKHAPVIQVQSGSGTGPSKLVDLFNAVSADLGKAIAAGTVPGVTAMPDTKIILTAVQSMVSSLKAQGLLQGGTPVSSAPAVLVPAAFPATKTMTMKVGDSLSILVTA